MNPPAVHRIWGCGSNPGELLGLSGEFVRQMIGWPARRQPPDRQLAPKGIAEVTGGLPLAGGGSRTPTTFELAIESRR
jgi:hypothetical protein